MNQRVRDVAGLAGREKPVAGKTQHQPAAFRRTKAGRQLFRRSAQIEQIHRQRQREVTVRVEALHELRSLMTEIGADGKSFLEFNRLLARMQPVALEFLAHGLRRKIGDVADHPRQRQADGGAVRLVVILAAVKMRIAANGVSAHDIKRQRLAGQSRRTGQHHRAAQPVGMPRGPGQCLMSAYGTADDRDELANAKVIQQAGAGFPPCRRW